MTSAPVILEFPDEPEQRRRNVMRSFTLLEISACDSPAQKGAIATILKRDAGVPEPVPKGMAPVTRAKRAGAAPSPPRDPFQLGETTMNPIQKALAAVDDEVRFRKRVERSWQMLIDTIRKRDNCSRITAAEKARHEHPREFANFIGS